MNYWSSKCPFFLAYSLALVVCPCAYFVGRGTARPLIMRLNRVYKNQFFVYFWGRTTIKGNMVKWPPRLISLIETDQSPILCHAANDSIVELFGRSAYQSTTDLNFLDLNFLLWSGAYSERKSHPRERVLAYPEKRKIHLGKITRVKYVKYVFFKPC